MCIFFFEIGIILLVVADEDLCGFHSLFIVLIFLFKGLHEGTEFVRGVGLVVKLTEF
jgi:hypothetical protein